MPHGIGATYDEVISGIRNIGYNPFSGNKMIKHVFARYQSREIELPQDQNYIIGLSHKHELDDEEFPCGTKLYYFPIIYTLANGERYMKESCFSESDKVNDFSNCYIICTK